MYLRIFLWNKNNLLNDSFISHSIGRICNIQIVITENGIFFHLKWIYMHTHIFTHTASKIQPRKGYLSPIDLFLFSNYSCTKEALNCFFNYRCISTLTSCQIILSAQLLFLGWKVIQWCLTSCSVSVYASPVVHAALGTALEVTQALTHFPFALIKSCIDIWCNL